MIFATSLAAALLLGTTPAPAPAPSPSPSPALTADQTSKIDGVVLGALREQAVTGISLAVVRDGRVVYSRGYGYSSVELAQTARDASLYEIGSVTKQFTAAAIMQLVDDGRLRLDMPLALFVPDFTRAKEITLRDLLAMRSGIPDYTDQPGFDKAVYGSAPPAALIASVSKLPLDFTPGTQWEYSNTNYLLLGMVVEKASRQSYGDYVYDKIVRPLNMAATHYGNAWAASPDLATGYVFDGPRVKPQTPWNLDYLYATGGMVSNVLDLAVWDAALLQGKVVMADSLRQMWTATSLADGRKIPYGYGWTIESLYGHREIDTNGALPGYSVRNAAFPNDRFDVVVMGNSKEFVPGPVVSGIFALFYPPSTAQIASQRAGDDAALARARDVFHRLQKGSLDASQLTAAAGRRLTPKLMAQARATLGALGAPARFEQYDKYVLGDETVYNYRVTLKRGMLGFEVSLDGAGKVGELTVKPL